MLCASHLVRGRASEARRAPWDPDWRRFRGPQSHSEPYYYLSRIGRCMTRGLNMKRLGTIDVRGNANKRIELLKGDLTCLGPGDAVDLLIMSAFPGDYIPTPTSLIGGLHRKGLSVARLAAMKDRTERRRFMLALTDHFCNSPWFSPNSLFRTYGTWQSTSARRRYISRAHADPRPVFGHQIGRNADCSYGRSRIFRQGHARAAARCGHPLDGERLPLDLLKIVAHSDAQSAEAEGVFNAWVSNNRGAPAPQSSKAQAEFDVFIRYAHENRQMSISLNSD